jgi:2-succinyl-5-enolpyruvyl-6-hydroxy-3-cyclohexene-1-carboxylate synthase
VPEFAAWRPEVVLRLGQPWASRVLSAWLATMDADVEQILVDPYGRWPDPERQSGRVVRCSPAALGEAVAAASAGPAAGEAPTTTDWATRWLQAESAAQRAIDAVISAHEEMTEPALARSLVAGAPGGSRLLVSSSMPVRDVEWFARPRKGLSVVANRGANGIDGIISTALGLATAGPVTALMGDLAFLYDAGALLWARQRPLDCVLVVVDNDGGGIFSFLPQAGGVPPEQFQRYWGTPHHLDLSEVAAAYRIPVSQIGSPDEIEEALAGAGVRMVHARTNRAANVVVHHEIEQAVAAAVSTGRG